MGLSFKEQIILKLATILKVNLKGLAFKGVGVGLSNDFTENGEKFLIDVILPKVLRFKAEIVMFDIGANVGDYTNRLSNSLSSAIIHSFEPNPHTFQILERKFKERKNVLVNNVGLGANIGKGDLYYYQTDKTTGHASISRKVFELNKRTDIDSSEIYIDTIDHYCRTYNILHIHFMKIDTEGFEYNVLLGANEMIEKGSIGLLQFEFNEMNISNRIFLKDFYDLLPGYHFYRLKKNSLFPLKEYSPKEEVFIIHNLVAVNKKLLKAVDTFIVK